MADAAALHRSFLELLFDRCLRADPPRARAIRLVARLRDPVRLRAVGTRWLTLFVPDLHLISSVAQQSYCYGFECRERGRAVPRALLLRAVVDAGLRFFAGHHPAANIATYQLGDLLDFWREKQLEGTVSLDVLLARVRQHHPGLLHRLFAKESDSLTADLVWGNHDHGLAATPGFRHALRAHAPGFGVLRGPKPVLITHGDVFDPVEAMLDEIQMFFVTRFGQDVLAHAYDIVDAAVPVIPGAGAPCLIEDPAAFDPGGIPDAVNVRQIALDADDRSASGAHELLSGRPSSVFVDALVRDVPGLLRAVPELRAGGGPLSAQLGIPALPDLRMVVVGHSHIPRLVSVGDPDEAGSFVLMDCGAWIERIVWPDPDERIELDSCQIGVLCGDDARIYQLDPV